MKHEYIIKNEIFLIFRSIQWILLKTNFCKDELEFKELF